jgi:hypothetical protein
MTIKQSVKQSVVQPFVAQGASQQSLTTALLLLLIVTDLTFIALHLLLFYTGYLNNDLFSLRKDKGYPEFFQYLKEGWIALLFTGYAVRRRAPQYLVWTALFGYMLLDDYLMLHETIGAGAADVYQLAGRWGLRGQDFVEVGFFAGVGVLFLLLLGAAYATGDRRFKQDSQYMVGLLLLFAVFAVVADVIHILAGAPSLDRLFDIVEDGGEMVVMSLIVWFTFTLIGRVEPTPITA